ncbi:MAG TPA: DUF192 domain-containing protein [Clostridia bacterium]|nr:MAG: hypothetical protein BWY62_00097 [Firmicutes bacterium ADurb.Bin356]HOF93927.1 DUF192 domain-containing protein [Clostridia bacterium]HOR12619.1 DUF192 domain-containing protein [Clostridia bacterium]
MKYATLYCEGGSSLKVRTAHTFLKRLFGLMGKRKTDGLLLYPCSQVHTYFMRMPIDVIYLDKRGKVLLALEPLYPNKTGKYVKDSFYVLELPMGGYKALNYPSAFRLEIK